MTKPLLISRDDAQALLDAISVDNYEDVKDIRSHDPNLAGAAEYLLDVREHYMLAGVLTGESE